MRKVVPGRFERQEAPSSENPPAGRGFHSGTIPDFDGYRLGFSLVKPGEIACKRRPPAVIEGSLFQISRKWRRATRPARDS
jgi:hypothetical protein